MGKRREAFLFFRLKNNEKGLRRAPTFVNLKSNTMKNTSQI